MSSAITDWDPVPANCFRSPRLAISESPSLARGAAAISIATAVSRLTGLVRVVVVAAAMGTTFLANTYQTANTAPNILFELLAAGVLTSVFVPTFVQHLVRGDRESTWDAVNALASVALAGLIGLSVLVAFAAPLIMSLLTLGVTDAVLRAQEIELGSSFLRLFAPQIVFYGAGMIFTAALHAHRRFALAAAAPIFNNLVVIAVYLAYALQRRGEPSTVEGISAGETLLLGAGTTAAVLAMTLVLVPGLMKLGWRFRLNFSLRHPAVRRGLRVGAWGVGYAGGYQASLIVVLLLANKIEGGVAAYHWAYTFFYVPHALLSVPVFSVLFTAMAEKAALMDAEGVRRRLSGGLGMLAVLLLPATAGLVVLSQPLARATLDYGAMTVDGAVMVGRVLLLLAVGLPGFSLFLVLTRAFYALSDSRTPALVNAGAALIAGVAGAVLFHVVPVGWEVAGLAAGHSLGFTLGALILLRFLKPRIGRVLEKDTRTTFLRSAVIAAVAGTLTFVLMRLLGASSSVGAMRTVLVAGAAGMACYAGLSWAAGISEVRKLVALVRR